ITPMMWSLPSCGTSAAASVAEVALPGTVALRAPSTSIFVGTLGSAVPGFFQVTATVPSAFRLQASLSTGKAQAPCETVLVGPGLPCKVTVATSSNAPELEHVGVVLPDLIRPDCDLGIIGGVAAGGSRGAVGPIVVGVDIKLDGVILPNVAKGLLAGDQGVI